MADCITALEYEHGIIAIDSGFIRPRMAACYLLETDSALAIIETGHNDSIGRMLQVIASRGRRVEEVSHVIVTHVHLDHAGGAGSLMRHLPNARLLVHPRGARHMIDPSKLEASARAVYGDEEFDRMYGSLLPVPEDRVTIVGEGGSVEVGNRHLSFIDTPGHARHHFCVWDEPSRGWFTGDTFGISYRELDSAQGAFIFPTSSPVQFDPEAMKASIQRMLGYGPQAMYLTHYGRVQHVQKLADDLFEQIDAMAAIGRQCDGRPDRHRCLLAALQALYLERAQLHGCALDDAAVTAVLAMDIELNAQGLACWLDRISR